MARQLLSKTATSAVVPSTEEDASSSCIKDHKPPCQHTCELGSASVLTIRGVMLKLKPPQGLVAPRLKDLLWQMS
jgi:hypothetical protein